MWTIVAALSAYNRGIGLKGRLPWRIPMELRLFRQETWGGVLIVGRRTWESLARPLPGRELWVLSRQRLGPQAGVRFFPGEQALLQALEKETRPVFFAGGEQLYRWALSLPQVQELRLSWVYTPAEADTFFPAFSEAEWQVYATEFFDACSPYPSFVRAFYKRIP
ncbi:MAG: dihydrofolate reductase [Bacteroidia bacterium]|nr:MAG: dihydrofolate reductase [Bacteroidia bacterium]